METPLYIALSRQEALRRQMDVVANNVSNMNTSGFKAQRMLFLEHLEKAAHSDERLSFVSDFGTMRDVKAGPLTVTSNPLDLALKGEGYFAVETLNGPRFTRAGNFQLNSNREIVDANGLPVLDQNDQRIVIPAGSVHITVKGDGQIETETGPVARLKVVTFANQQTMNELGGGLYTTDQNQIPVAQPEVTQGAIEGSNVQPVVEMTQMIEVMRAYQSTQKLLDNEHERMRTAIQRLARVQ